MAGLQEHLLDVVGLDVDLASTAAATAALADADRLLAGGVSSSSGGRGMTQYVPACVLAATRLARREGGGLSSGGGISWPRAQVGLQWQCDSGDGLLALSADWCLLARCSHTIGSPVCCCCSDGVRPYCCIKPGAVAQLAIHSPC